MKQFLISLILLLTTFAAHAADDYIESFNIVSDEYNNTVHGAGVIRQINGGTVVIPEFDESCPEELKGPFSHACKILEEYLYPSLPLRVKVSCGRLTGSSANSISKVKSPTRDNFGNNLSCNNSPMTLIKGVIVADLGHDQDVTYLSSVPNIEFLTANPDIEITYNESKLSEMSFSLDAVTDAKYDFISVALRDLLIGFGFSSGFRYDPVSKELNNPKRDMIPFESCISQALGGINITPAERLARATQGELKIKSINKSLNLYAPEQWKNGQSLNYFIPQDDCLLSQILSYNFCKGMSFRTISDAYDEFVFHDILGWNANFTTGSGASSSANGSTSLLMPYNGSLDLESTEYGQTIQSNLNVNSTRQRSASSTNTEVEEYAKQFHPFYVEDYEYPIDTEGISICLLKKDGTWDLVYYYEPYPIPPGEAYNMADWVLHCDNEEYARTIDGYLRARLTIRRISVGTGDIITIRYKSTFFVVDYLPQKVGLAYNFTDSTDVNPTSMARIIDRNDIPVRLYFSDIEGLDRIVLERLREGSRVPSKINVTDFRKGYFDTTIDKNTTFTAVGYNKNGSSRSLPLKITYPTPTATATKDLSFRITDDKILIDGAEDYNIAKSDIIPLDAISSPRLNCEMIDGAIDIVDLSNGFYVLNLYDGTGEMIGQYKFKK